MKKILLGMTVIFLLTGCGKDGNNDGSMTISKDGETFTVDRFNNTLVVETQQGQEGRRLDLRANVDGGTIIITVSNWEWQNPPEDGIVIKDYDTNAEFQGPNTECDQISPTFALCDGGLITYTQGLNVYVSEFADEVESGFIRISANDPDARTVSGSFQAITQNFFNGIEITWDGTFENLEY